MQDDSWAGDLRTVDEDRTRIAAAWVAAAEPSVSFSLDDGGIVLRSRALCDRRLADALLCSLLNERLLAENAAGRLAAMQELLG